MACVGLAIFIPNLFITTPVYPIHFHRKIMLEVFMNLALSGFLFAALPQFTKTNFINFKEAIYLVSTFIAATLFLSLGQIFIFHALIFSFNVYLMFFVVSRFVGAQENPPFSFLFLPIAIFWGLSAELLWLINELIPTPYLESTARYLLYNGYFLGVIAGVGIRLIPGLLGHTEIVKAQRKLYEEEKKIPKDFIFIVFLFNLFIMTKLFINDFLADAFEVFWLSLVSLSYWKIYKLPKAKTFHGFGVWLSLWLIFIGIISSILLKDQFSHWTHLTFVSGFLLLVVMVMTRVTIVHNKLGFEKEKSKWLAAVIGIIIFAALTRASAYLIPDSYQNHLAYASLLIIVTFGILVWFLRFFKSEINH